MTPDFDDIRRTCHGMMKTEVYKRIYETACLADGLFFVEIGSAHGAATVCLAKALQDTGRSQGKVYTFDKFSRSGRKNYGDKAENQVILKECLENFGVSGIVEIIPGDIAETYVHCPAEEIALLMLDSDGKIDRDFDFFYDKVIVNGDIIIDDMANRARATEKEDFLRIDQKHRLTYLLTRSAEFNGLILNEDMVNQTWFGYKLDSKMENWPHKEILSAYRELVFCNAELKK